ncbi:MAG TPA: flagellar filament capping protein FliD [Novosphingobium sp.]
MVTTSSTSSTTSATQTVAQTATAQLLSSLGAGSGIDMTALATNLATAQFAAKKDRLTTLSDKLDKQISAASTLKSAITNLSTSLGDRVRAGDLSSVPQIANAAVAKVSASDAGLLKGSYSVEVTTLATAQTLVSPDSANFAAGTDVVGAGSLTLRFGTTAGTSFTDDPNHAPISITMPAGSTLADVAAAINSKNAGVTAYISNTTAGAKLVLKGSEGSANSFALDATGDPGLTKLAFDPTSPGTGRLLTTAGNANLKIDGLPITSASNTLTDAIPGVVMTLTGTNSGAPTQVTFNDPSPAISSAMTDLVSALNEIVSQINTDTDSQTGDLARDSGALALKRTFQQLTSQILMPNAADGEPKTLSDLGVSIQRDGTFTLDSARLSKTLAANPQATAAMFGNGLNGIFATISKISTTMSSTSTDTKSYGATLANSIASLTKQKTQNTDDQTKLDDQQETLRQQMIARFSVTDSLVGTSKSTLSFLKNQIAAWNGTSNS